MKEEATARQRKGFPWGWMLLTITPIVILLMFLSGIETDQNPNYFRAKAMTEVRVLNTALSLYIHLFQAPPTGDHAEVIAALCGKNPQQIVLFDGNPKRLNARGEFLDPWGHPYRIDVSNPQSPNVYSFGENGIDEGGAEGSDDVASWR